VGGQEVTKFEKKFATITKSKYCISVANGTDALEIAVRSLNLVPGTEIIVPVNTWISTAEAVYTNNYKLVLCDINLDDYTISLEDLKRKINSKTSAIIAVHLFGNPANITGIKKIVANRNIKIIEDCAQAHGTKLNKIHVGKMGDVGTFSFFPGKNIGALGDAGAIITNNKKIYNYCLRAKNHGAIKKYDHNFFGRNSRLDTIQAFVLNMKLGNLNKILIKRNYLAKIYHNKLSNIPEINLYKLNKNNYSSYHQFVIRTNYRDKLKKYLKKFRIDTMIHYPYMINELKFLRYQKTFVSSKELGNKILSLPISEEHTRNEIIYICNKIIKFFNK
jgi:dTDP-4-amino-4,6-dideoxygalactose transaminase